MKRLLLALMTLWLAAPAKPALATDTVYYYYSNTLHSAVVETDAQGNIVERTTYYAPYGQVLNRSMRDGPGYTGREEDPATGLNYMQQRYYDPQSGRFVSTDPVVPTDDGGNFNRYWYASDNPYRYTDPTGTCNGTDNESKSCDPTNTDDQNAVDDDIVNNAVKGVAKLAVSTYNGIMSNLNEVMQASLSGKPLPVGATASLAVMLSPISLEDPALGGVANDVGVGFRSFSAFKRAEGLAGEGMQWHHIVEQTPSNIARFSPEVVHNTNNLVRLDVATHQRISAFYSSKPLGSDMTVRQWLSTQSFEEQYNFGRQTLQDFGGGQ